MIPITRPTLSKYEKYAPAFRKIIESGVLTNAKNVAELEKRVAKYLGVKYCVATSSCTTGLMLVLKSLNLKGEVILPSFTFSASGHTVLWNNLRPVFADIKPDTYEIDPKSIEKVITKKTTAILATHMFGHPCNIKVLEAVARKHKLKLIFDAAHAFGSSYQGKKIGNFGEAEVFSCSPTKLLTTGEGGLVATNNKEIYEFCRIGRNYGDDGSYNTKFNGLNARMSEFHAAVGLESLRAIDKSVKTRNSLVNYMKKGLLTIDKKIEFQKIEKGNQTTYKDFSLFLDPKKVGYDRDRLHDHLLAKGIISKKYFYPPLHLQKTYSQYKSKDKLLVTDKISKNVLSLPMYSHMSKNEADIVLNTIKQFYADL